MHAAYNWISLQLCCTDIRSAYVNLNISPTIWLGQIKSLKYDATQIPSATQADFDAMVNQLSLEFQYVSLVRLLQNNIIALYQDQQANISLLLQEDSDKILQNLQVDSQTPVKPVSLDLHRRSGLWSDKLCYRICSRFGGDNVRSKDRSQPGSLIAGDAAKDSNSPLGSPLKAQEENQEITTAQLAGQAASEFSATLVSLGNKFDRL